MKRANEQKLFYGWTLEVFLEQIIFRMLCRASLYGNLKILQSEVEDRFHISFIQSF